MLVLLMVMVTGDPSFESVSVYVCVCLCGGVSVC